MNRKKVYTIITSLIAIICLGMLVFTLILGKINEIVKKQADIYLSEATEQNINAIDVKINGNFELLKSIALNVSEYDSFSKKDVYELIKKQAQQYHFYRIMVINKNGISYTSDGYIKSEKDKEYFIRSINGENYISDIIESKMDNISYILASVPIYKDKEVVGVLCCMYKSEELKKLFSVSMFGGLGYSYLINNEGKILAGTRRYDSANNVFSLCEQKNVTFEENITLNTIKNNIKNSKSGVVKYINNKNIMYLKYDPINKNGWYIISFMPALVIEQQSKDISGMIMILCLVIIIIFTILINIIIYINNKRKAMIINEKRELELMAKRYKILAEQSDSIIFEYDINSGTIVHSSNYYAKFGTYPVTFNFPQSVIDKGLIYKDDVQIFTDTYAKVKKGAPYVEARYRFPKGENDYIWCSLQITTIFDENDKPYKAIGKIIDIDKEAREKQDLIQKAECDMFTSLYNKVTTKELIDSYLHYNSDKGIHAFIILDIDKFKVINDTYGHIIGDEILLKVANGLKALIRNSDIIGRVGGDEIVFLLKNIQSTKLIDTKLKEIISMFENIEINGQKGYVSATMGCSIYPKDGTNYDELFVKADKALYQSKNTGKASYSIYKD